MPLWIVVTIQIAASVGLIVCAIGLAGSQWAIMNVHRTHADLLKVLSAIQLRPVSGGHILSALNAVPFKTHMRAYMLFRDPWKLYDPCVLDALEHPCVEMMGTPIIIRGEDNVVMMKPETKH
jgi:hypothetical protein